MSSIVGTAAVAAFTGAAVGSMLWGRESDLRGLARPESRAVSGAGSAFTVRVLPKRTTPTATERTCSGSEARIIAAGTFIGPDGIWSARRVVEHGVGLVARRD